MGSSVTLVAALAECLTRFHACVLLIPHEGRLSVTVWVKPVHPTAM